jgi:hypothetical protein
VKWQRSQRRYRKILVEIRELLHVHDDRRFLTACGIIRALRRATPEHFEREAIRKTREDAQAIIREIGRIDGLLRSATLAPELRLRLSLDAAVADAPVARLLSALNEVRELCQAGDDNQPSTDQVRTWCARIAYTLMHRYSDERPTSGSPRSTYRVIASLLYEILTGERERDLKRACDDHLRGIRALENE